MPRHKLHGLKRPKVRQDWSKETLYNLSRLAQTPAGNKTFFQQKWLAKSLTRGFHNPYVRESQWTRMFDRRIPAVVPMSHQYLASTDGSEMAGGRGSGAQIGESSENNGLAQIEKGQVKNRSKTPYMHMAFGPLERRLDTAIWRALFASSVRQARQFVVHGWVTVNGKQMIYPGYQLNPGDMFAVDPERVMYATGARKRRARDPNSMQHVREQSDRDRARTGTAARAAQPKRPDDAEQDAKPAKNGEEADGESKEADPKETLKGLVKRAEEILENSKESLSGKRLQELRQFARSVKKTMGKVRPKDGTTEASAKAMDTTLEGLEKAFGEILIKIPDAAASTENVEATADTPAKDAPTEDPKAIVQTQLQALHKALERAKENPVDASKPYATPWRPRDYMSAFAFIPRYLEVNQNICAAVYLRHPVARPGLAEVATPFNGETMALAFNWYLRRR